MEETKEELLRLLRIVGRHVPLPMVWQCSYCRAVFTGRWKSSCPECKEEGALTGSVDPEGVKRLEETNEEWAAIKKVRKIAADHARK